MSELRAPFPWYGGKSLAVAAHMRDCATCIESLLEAGGESKADPVCSEYQRLKAKAKALAGQ
jgi:hypothetical protein